jgi:hypothetical protein
MHDADSRMLMEDPRKMSGEDLREMQDMFQSQPHRAVTIPSRIGRYGTTPIYEIAGLIHTLEMVLDFPPECVFVEIGSLLGKTTIPLASLRMHRVISIDPHDGPWEIDSGIGGRDRRIEMGNTLEKFKANLKYYGVEDNVTIVQEFSDKAAEQWNKEDVICCIFIDGCHEYEWVKHDYYAFKPFMHERCVIAFHDYNPRSFPQVVLAVDEIVANDQIEQIYQIGSMRIFQNHKNNT